MQGAAIRLTDHLLGYSRLYALVKFAIGDRHGADL